MNYCQVERDTEKHLAAQCLLDDANEAAEEAAEEQVNDPKSNYFWAESGNMLEALSESLTPICNSKNGTYQVQLQNLIIEKKYAEYGKLCEQISKEYWTEWLVDLVD